MKGGGCLSSTAVPVETNCKLLCSEMVLGQTVLCVQEYPSTGSRLSMLIGSNFNLHFFIALDPVLFLLLWCMLAAREVVGCSSQ